MEGSADEYAAAVATVHAHRARVRIARAQARHEKVELHRFILHEALTGPVRSDPPYGVYPVEGVRARGASAAAGAVVTVADLVRANSR